MKKIIIIIIIAVSNCIWVESIQSQNVSPSRNFDAFPATMNGLERHGIFLEQRENESDYQVELAAGMMKEIDCNSHSLIGTFEEKELKEVGFSFYVYHIEGYTMSTSKGCREPKRVKLVIGSNITIDYNSKHPLVVYAPKGVQIKYKIRKIGAESEE